MKELTLTFNNTSSALRTLAAQSIIDRARGLMFLKSTDKALLLLPCNSIHTFFMRFPIDALFVDRNNRIVQIIRDIKPFRIILPVFKASKVLEIPCGLLDSSDLRPGDLLHLPR